MIEAATNLIFGISLSDRPHVVAEVSILFISYLYQPLLMFI